MKPLLTIVILCSLTSFIRAAPKNVGTYLAVDGRSWHDFDLDGMFNDGVGSPFADQLVPFSNQHAAARAGLEFDLSAVVGSPRIIDAKLSLYFGNQVRDLNEQIPCPTACWGDPEVELHGYGTGDGHVGYQDVQVDQVLATFEPSPMSVQELDVTQYVRDVLVSGGPLVGFSVRIEKDLDPLTFAEAWFSSPSADPTQVLRPTLTIKAANGRPKGVPEPSSVVLLAIGLLASVRLRL